MNYQKYADKAFSKISQYGAPLIVKRAGKKVYDKKTNTYTDTGEEFSGAAIQREFDLRNIDGTNIKFGDVLLMASLGKEPKPNDTVTFGGKQRTVITVSALTPDGSKAIFYKIQAR